VQKVSKRLGLFGFVSNWSLAATDCIVDECATVIQSEDVQASVLLSKRATALLVLSSL
jgi:hypothetical protein